MKCTFVFCLVAILMGLVVAQNSTVCYSETIVTGDCRQRIRGYSYIAGRQRCKRFRTRACTVTGNFFRSRDECRVKCVPQREGSSDGESRFLAFMNRTMSQFQDMLSSLMNYASP